MASKKITWKNFIENMPQGSVETMKVDQSIFGVESVDVKRTIDMTAMTEFVADVVNMCIDKETAEYIPESYDFAIRLSVLNHYVGIPLPAGKDGAVQHMLQKAYFILYETDLFPMVMAHINQTQFNAMVNSISERIRFERDMLLSSVAQKANELINKMDEVMSESQSVLDHIDSENFGKAIENMSKLGMLGEDFPQADMNDSVTESVLPHDSGNDNIVIMKPPAKAIE